MKAMLLTAGLGTRLRPLTNRYAKPAVPFLGVPLLRYPLMLLNEAGVKSFVMNVHYQPHQIKWIGDQVRKEGHSVQISLERDRPLGSGGGIWAARDWLSDSDFFVANGDEVILPRTPQLIQRFLADHRRNQALATLLVMHHPLVGTQFGGVWANADGVVRGFGKDGTSFGKDCQGFHYIGLLLLSQRIFEFLPEGESNILYDALATAISQGEQVRIFNDDFTWFETGNPHDFIKGTGLALKLLNSGQGEDAKLLRAITQRHWPSGTSLSQVGEALVLRHASAKVENKASLSGFVVLEENSRIHSGAKVENCVLFAEATVKSGNTAINQIILPDPG